MERQRKEENTESKKVMSQKTCGLNQQKVMSLKEFTFLNVLG